MTHKMTDEELKIKKREYYKEYRKRNKDKIKNYCKKYYEANKEALNSRRQFSLHISTDYEPIWDELTEFALKSGVGRGVLLMECWNKYGEKIKKRYEDVRNRKSS